MVINSLQEGEWRAAVAVVLVVSVLVLLARKVEKKKRKHWRQLLLPPGPTSWPLVGCLPTVGFKNRHRTFYELSKKYGPVMQAPMGATTLIILHGPEMAQELFKTQDAQFCSRPLTIQGQYLGFEHNDVNLCPFNPTWQANRKAFSGLLVSPARITAQAGSRRELICSAVAALFKQVSMATNDKVHIGSLGDNLIANIIVRMLFGNRYVLEKNGRHSQDPTVITIAKALEALEPDLREGIALWGANNWADYWPFLAPLDLQGWNRRFRKLREKTEKLFSLIIQEHRDHPPREEEEDFISALLAQRQLTDLQLMGLISNALIAGIDTTARPFEWIMAELVANPESIRKAQEELDRVVGRERLMSEGDIEQLVYLQAIIKEALRMHPPAPFCDPHVNDHEKPLTLGGYDIPPNSVVLHNLWALGQDPSIWENPLLFSPDRFLGGPEAESVGVHGTHFHVLPFSSGRRRCPAYQFATLTLQHAVGLLLQAFHWAPHSSTGFVNLEEGEGILIGLKHPLVVSITPRLSPSILPCLE